MILFNQYLEFFLFFLIAASGSCSPFTNGAVAVHEHMPFEPMALAPAIVRRAGWRACIFYRPLCKQGGVARRRCEAKSNPERRRPVAPGSAFNASLWKITGGGLADARAGCFKLRRENLLKGFLLKEYVILIYSVIYFHEVL